MLLCNLSFLQFLPFAPQSQANVNLFWQYRLVFTFLEFYMSWVTKHVPLLASFTQHSNSEIHLYNCMYQLFIYFSCWVLFHCMNICKFMFLIADKHLCCFKFMANAIKLLWSLMHKSLPRSNSFIFFLWGNTKKCNGYVI
jgi:hypothetical protein